MDPVWPLKGLIQELFHRNSSQLIRKPGCRGRLSLVVMWAVGAATACGAGAGPATALVGVVETAAVELNAAGRERLGCRGAAAGAYNLGSLGHGVLNLKNVAAARALIFVARHNTSFSAQSGQIALPAKIQTAVTVPYIEGFITLRPRIYGCCAGASQFSLRPPQRLPLVPATSSCLWLHPARSYVRHRPAPAHPAAAS